MDLEIQKVLIRVMPKEVISKVFPIADNLSVYYFCMDRSPNGWWVCTRPKHHDGPHVRHHASEVEGSVMTTGLNNNELPYAWFNPPAQAQD